MSLIEPKRSPKKSLKINAKNFFHVSPKKTAPNVQTEKKKPVPKPSPPEDRQPPARQPPKPGGKNFFGKFRGEKTVDRNSMALPSLPTDDVDSRRYDLKPVSTSTVSQKSLNLLKGYSNFVGATLFIVVNNGAVIK